MPDGGVGPTVQGVARPAQRGSRRPGRAAMPAVGVWVALALAVACLRAQDPGPNLVTNSGFEADAAGSVPQGYGVWTSDGQGTCRVEDGGGCNSRRCLEVVGATSLACQYTIDVLPGETYLVESFCSQDGQGTASMAVYWKDASSAWNWPAGMARESYKPYEAAWRKAIARVRVPDQGVAKLTVLLCVEKQVSADDQVRFDGVSIRKTEVKPKPSPWPPTMTVPWAPTTRC